MAEPTAEESSLARYVPRLSAEWELETAESWHEIDGTLCYIDISGFTALSEKLARRGRIGAEELTEVLNFVFGKMLSVAYDRGGSLLKFGGDALLLVFNGPDHPVQACSAAVEMQAVLREARSYETSAGRLHLKMSVGLHSGTVHLFRAGDSHKELILTGPAASTTTEMEETAVAGEVLISSATRAALPARSAEKSKGDGWLLRWRKARLEKCGWSPRISVEPGAIAGAMPVALREYLQYGKAEPEHRIATVGFIKYQGVDALMESGGPAAVAGALDELIRNVQKAVDEEGVTFLASDIDQDGGKIILVAGVPGAQEDDEGRVLRAARRIADNAGTLELRIGINQGHVFVGEIGTDFRATYTIMGDTVNLAARLMAAASPGEVFASPSALDRSRTLFETTALEPFYVKGKEQPVQAYAVGAESGSREVDRTNELPFVGRVEEVAQLVRAIEDLEKGNGGAITVFGETGIGKSRLVDQVFPLPHEVHHVNIRSEPYGTATTYRPLRDPVRDLLGVERGPQAEMATQLREAVKAIDPTLLSMLPLIAEVAMIEVDPTPEADAIEPKFLPDRTADVLIDIFERVIPGPVLFEAEDGHWMDEASVHILERIVQATADRPWLAITTRRDDTGGFDARGVEIRLGPLLENEARELIIKATEAAPLRPHELAAIVERAGGLPLFLEEIIGAVREAGGVDSLPDSLDALVAAQIDALPPLPRRLLRYASVLGRSFRTATLTDLIADEEVELDSATRTQLLGFLDREGDGRMRFKHALLRDVAYSGLSFRRRRELHLRAGELAERAAGADVENVVDVLALHFSLGGDHERTWRYARIAGDQAKESYANVDAAAFYQSALDSARRLVDVAEAERAGVWTDLGEVRERAGLFAEALDAYHRAERLVKEDHEAVLELILKRSNVHRSSGAYSAALRETTRGTRLEYG
ncbi:MAG: AAA family ATPase, partial [Acidimicrobiia bacterium]|nr:AAA family ATPase [Acidimicrobiia bacterium]